MRVSRRRLSSLARSDMLHPILKYQDSIDEIPQGLLTEFVVEILKRKPQDRTPFDVSILELAIKNIDFFKKQPKDIQHDFLQCASYQGHEKDSEVFHIGSIGKDFFVIIEGEVGIYIKGSFPLSAIPLNERPRLFSLSKDANKVNYTSIGNQSPESPTGGPKYSNLIDMIRIIYLPSVVLKDETVCFQFKVNTLYSGQSFGEIALIDDKLIHRTASVITHTKSHFAVIGKEDYRSLLGKHHENVVNQMTSFLKCVQFFAKWDIKSVKTLRYQFKSKSYAKGEVVFHHGEPCRKVSIICKGKVQLLREVSYLDMGLQKCSVNPLQNFNKNRSIPFAILTDHDVVGEEDVYFCRDRTFTCVCLEHTEMLEIPGEEIMKRLLFEEKNRLAVKEIVTEKMSRWDENFQKFLGIAKENLSILTSTPLVYRNVHFNFGPYIHQQEEPSPSNSSSTQGMSNKSKSLMDFNSRDDSSPERKKDKTNMDLKDPTEKKLRLIDNRLKKMAEDQKKQEEELGDVEKDIYGFRMDLYGFRAEATIGQRVFAEQFKQRPKREYPKTLKITKEKLSGQEIPQKGMQRNMSCVSIGKIKDETETSMRKSTNRIIIGTKRNRNSSLPQPKEILNKKKEKKAQTQLKIHLDSLGALPVVKKPLDFLKKNGSDFIISPKASFRANLENSPSSTFRKARENSMKVFGSRDTQENEKFRDKFLSECSPFNKENDSEEGTRGLESKQEDFSQLCNNRIRFSGRVSGTLKKVFERKNEPKMSGVTSRRLSIFANSTSLGIV